MQTMNDALYQLYMNREVRSGRVPAGVARPERVPPHDRRDARCEEQEHRARSATEAPAQHAATPPLTGRATDAACSNTPRERRQRPDPEGHSSTSPTRDEVIALAAEEPADPGRASARRPSRSSCSWPASGIKTRDIVIFTRQFSTMINAGLPLVQALDILAKQTENKTLTDVTRAVVSTTSSPATRWPTRSRKHPKAFTRPVREHGRRR